jgi:hypothetical protein
MHEYLVGAAASQWMIVEIFSPAANVYLSVTGVRDGQPYLRSAAGATSWRARLMTTQDYSLKAVSGGTAARYTLQVIIPVRVNFAPGATSVSLQGLLRAGEANEYTLRALEGQTMTATIAAPPTGALLEIYGLEDGQPLVRVPAGVTTWTGVLPGTQDYNIKVVSVGPTTSYALDVTIE